MSRPLPPREFARDPLDPHPVPTGWTNEHARVFAASLLVPLFILAVGVRNMQLVAPLVDPGVPCRARSAADPAICVDADWRCAVLKLANPARDAAPDPALGLRFIHVPKTGGTGIGVADAHFEDRERKKKISFSRDGAACRCSSWHVPPRHRPWAATVFGGGERSFCVVRDPLARLLSEFRFRRFDDRFDAAKANAWLRDTLPKLDSCDLDCHLLPQHEFVWDARGRRTCDHALRHENLKDDFAALMRAYNRTTALPRRLARADRRLRAAEKTGVAVGDVDPWLARDVRCAYAADLCLLGYDAHGVPGFNASLATCSGEGPPPVVDRGR